MHRRFSDHEGPRDLIIFDANAIKPILGSNAQTRRGPFYSASELSLHVSRDKSFHRQRRKIWDMAFKHILSDYGPTIEDFTDTLLARVKQGEGSPIIINDLCIHYTYDVMSSLAFGDSTKFLERESTATATRVVNGIQIAFVAFGALVHVPWVLTILECISFASPLGEFSHWSAEQVEKRRNVGSALAITFLLCAYLKS
jgi:cytochrome P450